MFERLLVSEMVWSSTGSPVLHDDVVDCSNKIHVLGVRYGMAVRYRTAVYRGIRIHLHRARKLVGLVVTLTTHHSTSLASHLPPPDRHQHASHQISPFLCFSMEHDTGRSPAWHRIRESSKHPHQTRQFQL